MKTATRQDAAPGDNREVRKVQFTGRPTYVLSLPKKWIEEMHIRADYPVTFMRGTNNSLSIMPLSARVSESLLEATAVILAGDSSNSVKRKVVSLYLEGYNVIHLKLKAGRINPALHNAVREVTRHNLVGTEMIADASDTITLQVLLSLPELSVNTAIRCMYLIASSMHKDSMTALGAQLRACKGDDKVRRRGRPLLNVRPAQFGDGYAERTRAARDGVKEPV